MRKGNPHNLNEAMFKVKLINGILKLIILIKRISWWLKKLWIIIPEHKNRSDLNIAWVIKWKKARFFCWNEIDNIINPNCLNVDKAIIFLKSNSYKALEPAINIVNDAIIIIINNNILLKIYENRIIK